jgi:pantoate--beta-alanine ligase
MSTPVILRDPASARRWTLEHQASARRVALVPTMGALHRGHLALVDVARSHADHVIVSIFVNPTQFNRAEDFDSYPRVIDDDLAICAEHGVDAVYLPAAEAMYPSGFDTRIEPGSIASKWEGEHRAGHFSGVATVVIKLLNACAPDVAVFGAKDLQQLTVIRRTVTDLDLGVDIVAGDTIRESDGLAMSSRNRRLDSVARQRALAIHRGLLAAVACANAGHGPDAIERAARDLIDPAADDVEYVAVVDSATFERSPTMIDGCDYSVIVAAWFGGVRLIDNMALPRSA